MARPKITSWEVWNYESKNLVRVFKTKKAAENLASRDIFYIVVPVEDVNEEYRQRLRTRWKKK